MIRVAFFTRDACPLCSAAWYVVQRVRAGHPFELERVDIAAAGNEHWLDVYGAHIPVIHINGREAFRHRVDERLFREEIQRAAGAG